MTIFLTISQMIFLMLSKLALILFIILLGVLIAQVILIRAPWLARVFKRDVPHQARGWLTFWQAAALFAVSALFSALHEVNEAMSFTNLGWTLVLTVAFMFTHYMAHRTRQQLPRGM